MGEQLEFVKYSCKYFDEGYLVLELKFTLLNTKQNNPRVTKIKDI
jgi:hypothetical protein